MIIYGSKSKELAKETFTDKCQNCGTQHSIDMHVFQKYAHIFWIPLFPLGKTGISQCDHCKQVLKLKEMPASLIESYNNLKAQTKTPVWMFSGLALLAILIFIGVMDSKKKDEKNTTLILTPKSGDIFEIKTKENQYTLYKVDEVVGDTAFVRTNNFETNKSTGLSELKEKGDTAYTKESFGFTKVELKTMLEKGEIIDIDRK